MLVVNPRKFVSATAGLCSANYEDQRAENPDSVPAITIHLASKAGLHGGMLQLTPDAAKQLVRILKQVLKQYDADAPAEPKEAEK